MKFNSLKYKTMNRKILLFIASLFVFVGLHAQSSETTEPTARSMKEYDISAFCSYSTWHPSQYILDNSWDIHRYFRTPATLHTLKSAGIEAHNSQIRLLRVGGLLDCRIVNDSALYHTVMPIFSKEQTDEIRLVSKAMADSVFEANKKDFNSLIKLFKKKGWENQTYSLVFSALLDKYIWDDTRIVKPKDMTDHGTWSGVYWAMYSKRPDMKCGTNSYGPVNCNWSDSLGYWLNDNKLIRVANDIKASQKPVITDSALAENLSQWGICNADGSIIVPVIYRGSGDEVDNLCNKISDNLCAAVKAKADWFMRTFDIANKDEAEVILYHEMMYDLLALLESRGIVKKPAILLGEETGTIHFGDIVFIML